LAFLVWKYRYHVATLFRSGQQKMQLRAHLKKLNNAFLQKKCFGLLKFMTWALSWWRQLQGWEIRGRFLNQFQVDNFRCKLRTCKFWTSLILLFLKPALTSISSWDFTYSCVN
jgi:hypothetical protein